MKIWIAVLLLSISLSVFARGVYQSDEDFLADEFHNAIPKSEVMWIKGDLRQAISNILGHNYNGLRIRYWQQEGRSVWILEEIGKIEPIIKSRGQPT